MTRLLALRMLVLFSVLLSALNVLALAISPLHSPNTKLLDPPQIAYSQDPPNFNFNSNPNALTITHPNRLLLLPLKRLALTHNKLIPGQTLAVNILFEELELFLDDDDAIDKPIKVAVYLLKGIMLTLARPAGAMLVEAVFAALMELSEEHGREILHILMLTGKEIVDAADKGALDLSTIKQIFTILINHATEIAKLSAPTIRAHFEKFFKRVATNLHVIFEVKKAAGAIPWYKIRLPKLNFNIAEIFLNWISELFGHFTGFR